MTANHKVKVIKAVNSSAGEFLQLEDNDEIEAWIADVIAPN
jgi:hypothetical protein